MICSQWMSMSQDTRSGHLQRIPMTGRAMDDTAVTDTTTDYRTQDGTPVTVQSPCFAMGFFIHLHWLHNDLIASPWPFYKVGQVARRFPIKWEPKGPSWAIRALCRWYTRCIPISSAGMGPPSSAGLWVPLWWQVLLALFTWHWHMALFPQDPLVLTWEGFSMPTGQPHWYILHTATERQPER